METENVFQEIDAYILEAVEQDDVKFEDPKKQATHELYLRSKAVKGLVRAYQKDYEARLHYIKQRYKKEINFSKENRFQKMAIDGWIKRNHGIQKNLESYPLLIPMLDYLFNQRRKGIRQKHINEMSILSDHRKYNGHPFSCFVADNSFYLKMEKALNKKRRTIQRYIKGLIAIGAIREIKNLEHNIKVYADGYYTPFDNGSFIKHPLLKNNMYFRNGLKAFRPMN